MKANYAGLSLKRLAIRAALLLMLAGVWLAMVALIRPDPGPEGVGSPGPQTGASRQPLTIAKVFFEFNASDNDLGVHVFLDGEDWKTLTIVNPQGRTIFEVDGKGPYANLGMTELFFEGAEPSLNDVPLEELLALFPEGTYTFVGRTVDGATISGTPTLTHAIPNGPNVSATPGPNNTLSISWEAVTAPPPGFPDLPITIVGYQVIIGSFQVTLPATTLHVTVPPEFVASLSSGEQEFEVLAIEASGNQSLTMGTFVMP